MSFPKYPAYKDSGVEWLGEVPEHWNVSAVKYLLKPDGYKAGPFGSALITSNLSDTGTVLVMTPEHVARQSFDLDFNQYLPDERIVAMEVFKVQQGDVVLPIVGTLGRAMVIAHPIAVILNQRLARISPDAEKLHPQYLKTLLTDYDIFQQLDLVEGKGAILSHITKESLINRRLAVPPLPEQKLILIFLDHETAKIDALVAEQEKLITLLQEKRQAVISHAVTKGLNPNVPMKDSGVEWLGEVPVHWSVQRIKHIVATMEQGWSPQCEGFPVQAEEEWGVLKVGCVNGGVFRPEENKTLPSELEPIPELGIKAGDLLISRANTRELVGSAAIALQNYPRLLLCDKLYRLRLLRQTCEPMFLSLYLGSDRVRGQIELAATGASSSMLNIGQSTILEMDLVVPPLDEQHEILRVVAEDVSRIDALTVEANSAIAFLQERRTALISAAVTGQIDVRNWSAQEAA